VARSGHLLQRCGCIIDGGFFRLMLEGQENKKTQQQDEEDSTGDQQDIVSAHMKGWTDLEESRERACFNQQVQNA